MKKSSILILSTVVLLTGCGQTTNITPQEQGNVNVQIFANQNNATSIENVNQNNANTILPKGDYPTTKYEYSVETTWLQGGVENDLYRKSKSTGKSELVIKEIKKNSLLFQKYPSNLGLSLALVPKSKPFTLVFASRWEDTDAGSGPMFSYNIQTGEFSLMKVNDIQKSWSNFAESKDMSKIVVADEEKAKDMEKGWVQQMYLLDLETDTYKLVVELKGNETFNGGGYALSSMYQLEWVGGDTIKYSVFDQSKKGIGESKIGVRTLKVVK